MPSPQAVDALSVEAAAQALAQGGLVAFPTETVYGLGARADDDAAVARIFEAKGRPSDHPLIVHVLDEAGARAFAQALPPVAVRLMKAFWPGPVTVIVPRRAGMGAASAGGQDSIGLRCPSHPVARELLRRALALGVLGVAAPSANRFGRVSPTTADHVRAEFGAAVPVLEGGACEAGIESAIVDCTRGEPVLLRPGTVDRRALERAAGAPLRDRDAQAPRASGTLESHYAPVARVRLVASQDWPRAMERIRTGGLAGVSGTKPLMPAREAAAGPAAGSAVAQALALYSRAGLSGAQDFELRVRQMPLEPAEVAHELFAVLRELDAWLAQQGGGEIWVEEPPAEPEWEGVRDRLSRAAA